MCVCVCVCVCVCARTVLGLGSCVCVCVCVCACVCARAWCWASWTRREVHASTITSTAPPSTSSHPLLHPILLSPRIIQINALDLAIRGPRLLLVQIRKSQCLVHLLHIATVETSFLLLKATVETTFLLHKATMRLLFYYI